MPCKYTGLLMFFSRERLENDELIFVQRRGPKRCFACYDNIYRPTQWQRKIMSKDTDVQAVGCLDHENRHPSFSNRSSGL